MATASPAAEPVNARTASTAIRTGAPTSRVFARHAL